MGGRELADDTARPSRWNTPASVPPVTMATPRSAQKSTAALRTGSSRTASASSIAAVVPATTSTGMSRRMPSVDGLTDVPPRARTSAGPPTRLTMPRRYAAAARRAPTQRASKGTGGAGSRACGVSMPDRRRSRAT